MPNSLRIARKLKKIISTQQGAKWGSAPYRNTTFFKPKLKLRQT